MGVLTTGNTDRLFQGARGFLFPLPTVLWASKGDQVERKVDPCLSQAARELDGVHNLEPRYTFYVQYAIESQRWRSIVYIVLIKANIGIEQRQEVQIPAPYHHAIHRWTEASVSYYQGYNTSLH